jgi:hypothetical protein
VAEQAVPAEGMKACDIFAANITMSNPKRTLDQERDFIENLVSARFNYFMLLFGVVLVYAYTAPCPDHRVIILSYGTVGTAALAFTIHRVHVKLDHILSRLHKIHGHPVQEIGMATADQPDGSVEAAWLLGKYIPTGCSLALLALTIFSVGRMGLNGEWPPAEIIGAAIAGISLVGWYCQKNPRWLKSESAETTNAEALESEHE